MRHRTRSGAQRQLGIGAAVVLATALSAVVVPATRAIAQADPVTLTASRTSVRFGSSVTLTVQLTPPAGGQAIDILDDTGHQIASGHSDANGQMTATITPRATVTLHAVSAGDHSADVVVHVRAVVRVRLGAVRLFDRVVVTGTVRPQAAGDRVAVALAHRGRRVALHRPATTGTGRFRTTFAVRHPGAYRVRARFGDATHLAGMDTDGPRSTPLPTLRTGAHSVFVRLLERRLVALHYRLVRMNRGFDFRTADAVMAFRKVQRMPRTNTVDASVWRALADPVVPHPRGATHGFHIEVDQTRQVLYTVRDGRVTNVIHVSTGKPSTPTPDGAFTVYRKLAGYSPHLLYYPSYFDGNRAIHGWPDVPSYAASHGCVRVSYWNAQWIFGLAATGTRVLVYHE